MRYLQILIFAFLFASTAAIAAPPIVAIDVGHGLSDGGATSARGIPEFEFNRIFALRLAERMREGGFVVHEVNFAGDIGRLAERPAQAVGSDFFISIHHDSVSQPYLTLWDWDGSEASYTELKRGFGLFVSAQNPDLPTSLRCASRLGAALRRAGFVPTPWHGRKHLPADAENGVWYYDHLVVLYRTSLPAVLFEAGVIKHREEELELRDSARQTLMADALVSGFADCLPLTEKSARE